MAEARNDAYSTAFIRKKKSRSKRNGEEYPGILN